MNSPPSRRLGGVLAAGCVCAVMLAGCKSMKSTDLSAIPLLGGDHRTAEGVDPARTPHHGWGPVDTAVGAAAMEMLIIARPVEGEGILERVYTLRTLHGQPGELRVTRRGVGLGIEPSEGLTLECRLGRRGERVLEDELLERTRAMLIEQHTIEHELVDY